jgi:hypothetical protein
MREGGVRHKSAVSRGHGTDYLSRMLMRSLCTGLLALLAWLPVGHAQRWALRGSPREPALAASSALDIAADSPSRIGNAGTFSLRTLPPRRLGRAHAGEGASFADVVLRRDVSATRPFGERATRPQAPRPPAARLTIPYDATAPPRHQS